MPQNNHRSGPLMLIAVAKLAKASLLILVAIGAHNLLHQNVADTLGHWAHRVRIDPHNRYIHAAIEKVTGVSQKQLELISFGTFLYASIFIVEGIGLLLEKRWAEYLTVVTTGLLLPIEVYELIEKPTVVRGLVFAANVAILVYLIIQLRRTRKSLRHATPESVPNAT